MDIWQTSMMSDMQGNMDESGEIKQNIPHSTYRKLNQLQLDETVELHNRFLDGRVGGRRANFRNTSHKYRLHRQSKYIPGRTKGNCN